MTPSEELFDLICSLTPSEKRYFKIFASRHTLGEVNNYVRLFDAVEKQKKYDEKRIKEIFKNESLVKRLSSEKSYLFNFILESLNSFHLNSKSDSILRKQLNQLEILSGKALYESSEKLFEKIYSRAMELEKYEQVYEALKWRNQLMLRKSFYGVDEKKLAASFKEKEVVLQKLSNINKYTYLRYQVDHTFTIYGKPRNKKELERYEKIMKSPLLKIRKHILCNFSEYLYNNIYISFYAFIKNECAKAVPYINTQIKLIESEPKKIIDNPSFYIHSLFHALMTYSGLGLKGEKEFLYYLEKLKNIERNYPLKLNNNQGIDVATYLNLELKFCNVTGKFERAKSIIPDVEKRVTAISGKVHIRNELTTYYEIAYAYFGMGQHKESLKWLNKIMDYPEYSIDNPNKRFSKILHLIILSELEDVDFLPYAFRSVYRFLIKRQNFSKGEFQLMDFLKKSLKIKNNQGLIGLYKSTRDEFVKINRDPFERSFLSSFDFISWLESKIEKRPFAEVVTKNAEKRAGMG